MMKCLKFAFIVVVFILMNISFGHTTQRSANNIDNNNNNNNHKNHNNHDHDDSSNPLFDMASAFLQETLSNQGANVMGDGVVSVGGIAGVASLIGNLMQSTNGGGYSNNGGKSNSGASQILSGIGSLLSNSNRGGTNGFDAAMIGNVIDIFTNNNNAGDSSSSSSSSSSKDNEDSNKRQKRNLNNNLDNDNDIDNDSDGGIGLDSILQIASTLISSQQQQQQEQSLHDKNRGYQDNNNNNNNNNNGNSGISGGIMSLLPMVMQAINSFNGPEGQRTQEKHKEHAWVLPPFLEQMHVLWDHFSSSDLADALWQKSGVYTIFKGFTGRDGKLDYDKLFESLHNQSFRRRWIKAATLYLADWTNYLADPDVYQRSTWSILIRKTDQRSPPSLLLNRPENVYLKAGVLLFNGFLKSQGFPSSTYFDPSRPSDTISNLLDHIALKHLNVKVDSRQYVMPAVNYGRELLKLGQARGLIQKFNATELSDKLTDTLNLEVIEPVLKVHRAYRFATETPYCDKYVLCQLNSHDPNEKLGLAGFKPGITKFGSMAAAWFISLRSGTPFWTLISTINEPYNCEVRFPVDCTAFHEGEAKVTTEYFHNEL